MPAFFPSTPSRWAGAIFTGSFLTSSIAFLRSEGVALFFGEGFGAVFVSANFFGVDLGEVFAVGLGTGVTARFGASLGTGEGVAPGN